MEEAYIRGREELKKLPSPIYSPGSPPDIEPSPTYAPGSPAPDFDPSTPEVGPTTKVMILDMIKMIKMIKLMKLKMI